MPLVIEDRLPNAERQDIGPRMDTKVDTLVIHTTEGGSIAGAVEWWRRKEVIGSAHYLLTADRIEKHVEEWLAAYHAGNLAVNRRSIGIEVVGHCAKPELWSPAVLRQLVRLSADIVQRHGIPVLHQPGPGICGHVDVPDPSNPNMRGGIRHHTDPGPHFPWGLYLEHLRGELALPTV